MNFHDIKIKINAQIKTWHMTNLNPSHPKALTYTSLTVSDVHDMLKACLPEITPNTGLYLDVTTSSVQLVSQKLKYSFVTFKIKKKKCMLPSDVGKPAIVPVMIPTSIDIVEVDMLPLDIHEIFRQHDRLIQGSQSIRTKRVMDYTTQLQSLGVNSQAIDIILKLAKQDSDLISDIKEKLK